MLTAPVAPAAAAASSESPSSESPENAGAAAAAPAPGKRRRAGAGRPRGRTPRRRPRPRPLSSGCAQCCRRRRAAGDPEPAPDEPAPKRPRAASELSGGPYKRPKGRAPADKSTGLTKLWDSHAGQWVLPTDGPAEAYAPAAGEWPAYDASAAYDDDVGEAAEALGEPVGDDEISRGEILAEGIALPEVGSIPIVAAVPVPMEDEEEADAEEEAGEGGSCDGRTTRRCDCASS